MRQEFDNAWARGGVRAVWREVVADHDTPVSAFRRVARGSERFLLESVEGGEVWGRYSFFGSEPCQSFTATDDALSKLRDLLGTFRQPEPLEEGPRFLGGAIGCLTYDLHARFVIPEWFCVFDRLRSRIRIVALAIRRDAYADADAAWTWAQSKLDEIEARLRGPLPEAEPREVTWDEPSFVPAPAAFEAAVARAKEYIVAGDIIQVVLSRRMTGHTNADPFDVYRALRLINPSPYMFYLHLGDRRLAGSSPEVLTRVERGIVTTRPIAGTRPRGANDDELEAELLADPKERAEHLMLVDLGRNDIGRVAATGTVEVPSFMRVERYSHVMHIVSDVTGRLRDDCDAFDAVASCFPAGTLSGAPKIRAMEIIEELETHPRGVYGGAIGYFGFDGNADTCITIRTVEFVGANRVDQAESPFEVHIQAGAGIVYDSNPAAETEETEAKARGMLRAIELVRSGALA